ncbi:MAG: adenosylcobalamin-dependent ribonucleoside-diphosphate reductase, partial [Parcubacteria group bacterium]|nr:adenosylcobalamin-dependent ribonucleoside-diphosphate reductase [Parcubacteria group bacterium]
KRKYLKKDKKGQHEKVSSMFRRIARNIASADKNYTKSKKELTKTEEEFFEVMNNLEFLSGMTLRNAGRKLQQLSACYVLPIEDSMDSIYTTLKDAAFLHKTGAGIGYDFSKLRPENDLVSTTKGKSSGPLSFMKLYDFSSETVVNNASTRRAGNMGILRIDHPDILEFIKSKEGNDALGNFNISVAVTDKFMKAVADGRNYNLINPKDNKKVGSLKARKVFSIIVEKAWQSAEPGIIFIDTVNKYNQTPGLGRIEATNLCGEQPLLAYEACNLGSIILSKFIKNNEGEKEVDYERLEEVINIAIHFLDNSIDVNNYPLPEIEEINQGNRKIGLGVMGFADMLAEFNIPYNSDEAVKFSEKLMKFIQGKAREASVELAKVRGNFPNFSKSIWPKKGFRKLRNATVTTIAPNGTTSIFANCSSGIEPIFGLVYVRKNIMDLGKDELVEVNPTFEKVAKEKWLYSRNLMEKVAERGTIKDMEEIPEEIQKVFVTAHDIEPEWHIKIQAAFQKYTDNAVSKTVNLPHNATLHDVEEAFKLAYALGCKGTTVYRDRSRDKQVLNYIK